MRFCLGTMTSLADWIVPTDGSNFLVPPFVVPMSLPGQRQHSAKQLYSTLSVSPASSANTLLGSLLRYCSSTKCRCNLQVVRRVRFNLLNVPVPLLNTLLYRGSRHGHVPHRQVLHQGCQVPFCCAPDKAAHSGAQNRERHVQFTKVQRHNRKRKD